MSLLKKELYKSAKGPVANDEDWWRLVFDTDARRLYVEHEWAYVGSIMLPCRPRHRS